MSDKSGIQHNTDSSDARSPSRIERFKTLMIENPLVPIGIIFTGAVLINGARTMRSSGNSVHKIHKGKYMQDSPDE
ncbi:hypothetical protein TcWFU_003920 [Taenia crassiceps]|uniref:HIG1 domain-containing protein n=1 Tax=Taenia crassiceps TaxID=6207 RepID=A0ABR4Q420_9CEST